MSQCKKSFAEKSCAVSNLFHASVGTLPMQTHNKKRTGGWKIQRGFTSNGVG